jgi:hypothetical protein
MAKPIADFCRRNSQNEENKNLTGCIPKIVGKRDEIQIDRQAASTQ